MLRFATSSWSLDGQLSSGLPLLELPQELRRHGIGVLELCHFHLPSTEPAYLAAFRARLRAAEVELYSVLIDAGDVAAPEPERRGLELIRHHIRVAAALGAERVRISAGQQPPTPEALARSAAELETLISYAAAHGVAVSTENWQRTATHPEAVLTLLRALPDGLGLCVDTGNAEATADKYGTLAQLLPHATSVHFKARTTPQGTDQDDLRRCGELLRAASFSGPLSLIYDRKQGEWEGLEALKTMLEAFYPAASSA